MNNQTLVRYGFFHSLAVAVYIALVVFVMQNGQKWFDSANNILGGVAILLLFVLSAAVVGALILGKPAILYFGGQKTEAVKLFFFTLGWLFLFVILTFLVLVIR